MSDTYRAQIGIAAAPDRVFDHFVQPQLLVRWMGDFAQLEAKDCGLFAVDINGVIIRGTFVRVERPSLLEIAWGEAGTRRCHRAPRVSSCGSRSAAEELSSRSSTAA